MLPSVGRLGTERLAAGADLINGPSGPQIRFDKSAPAIIYGKLTESNKIPSVPIKRRRRRRRRRRRKRKRRGGRMI